MQQQVLASKVGMGAAALCALEKGRRPVPTASRVADIGEALALGREELVALQRWADHDRLVAYLEKQGQAATVCADLARHADALTRVAALDRDKPLRKEKAM
jgi:transcriptional regulator with XRE-family HTH domain